MRDLILNLKDKFSNDEEGVEEIEEGYIELGAESEEDDENKVIVRPYILEEFDDIKEAINALREGYTIALINIGPLKNDDIIELKRAVNKLKKTCNAIDGDIAGFGEDYIVAVPNFAEVYRGEATEEVQHQE